MTRFLALILAYLFLALAVIGIFLPGIPTVPFLLLTAWFAAKGSEKLHRWLYEHPHFGRLLIDWETQKAVSRRSKCIAVAMLLASWLILVFRFSNLWILAAVSLLFVAVGAFLVSRPEPH